jgi:hypothetical protein
MRFKILKNPNFCMGAYTVKKACQFDTQGGRIRVLENKIMLVESTRMRVIEKNKTMRVESTRVRVKSKRMRVVKTNNIVLAQCRFMFIL